MAGQPQEDLEFLNRLFASSRAPFFAGIGHRVVAGVAGMALVTVCLGGALAFHATLAEGSRRAPARAPTRPLLAHAGIALFPALLEIPLEPIQDASAPSPSPVVAPREPNPDIPAPLAGPAEKQARRYLATIGAALKERFELEPLGPLEVIEAARTRPLPGWMNLRYTGRVLAKALEADGLDPAALTVDVDDAGAGALELRLPGSGDAPGFALRLEKPRARSRVAVVVDDVGYGGPSTRKLLPLPAPLNIAILPFYYGSKKAAAGALEHGHDPMLHMPFQPKGAEGKYRAGVVVHRHLPPEEIRRRTLRALDSLPGVVGLNNHMGSRGTESWFVCAEVLGVARERGLFFVDSVTSPRSVAHSSAKKLGLRTAKRNTSFLDNEPTVPGVRAALRGLRARCDRGGDGLIAIMHDKPESVEALAAELPAFREAGIELAFAADLVR